MPGFIGPMELIVLGIVVLLVFGPKRLPEMGRSLGKGLREFKHSMQGIAGDHEHEPSTVALATATRGDSVQPPERDTVV